MSELVKIATYRMLADAQIAHGRLAAEGIPASMTDVHLSQMIPGTVVDITLLVAPEHESNALRILATDYSEELDDDETT